MKRIVKTAATLSTLMLLSGMAYAEQEAEVAPDHGVDSANQVEDSANQDQGTDAMLNDESIVEDGGVDSANENDQPSASDDLGDGEVAPDHGVDSDAKNAENDQS